MPDSTNQKVNLHGVREQLNNAYRALLDAFELSEDGNIFTYDEVIVWANSTMARMLSVPDRTAQRQARGSTE